jgi:hypothetical protein
MIPSGSEPARRDVEHPNPKAKQNRRSFSRRRDGSPNENKEICCEVLGKNPPESASVLEALSGCFDLPSRALVLRST